MVNITLAEPDVKPSSKSAKAYSKASSKSSKPNISGKASKSNKSGKGSKKRLFRLEFQTSSVPQPEVLHADELNNASATSSPHHVALVIASFAITLIGHIWSR